MLNERCIHVNRNTPNYVLDSSQRENCQAAVGTGFQLPQRVNNSHRAGSPQICGFHHHHDSYGRSASVRSTVHNNNNIYVYSLKIREKSCTKQVQLKASKNTFCQREGTEVFLKSKKLHQEYTGTRH